MFSFLSPNSLQLPCLLISFSSFLLLLCFTSFLLLLCFTSFLLLLCFTSFLFFICFTSFLLLLCFSSFLFLLSFSSLPSFLISLSSILPLLILSILSIHPLPCPSHIIPLISFPSQYTYLSSTSFLPSFPSFLPPHPIPPLLSSSLNYPTSFFYQFPLLSSPSFNLLSSLLIPPTLIYPLPLPPLYPSPYLSLFFPFFQFP